MLVTGSHEALGRHCTWWLYNMLLYSSASSPSPSCVVPATTRNGFRTGTHVFRLLEVWNLRCSKKFKIFILVALLIPNQVNQHDVLLLCLEATTSSHIYCQLLPNDASPLHQLSWQLTPISQWVKTKYISMNLTASGRNLIWTGLNKDGNVVADVGEKSSVPCWIDQETSVLDSLRSRISKWII